jgi:hypothetical protein
MNTFRHPFCVNSFLRSPNDIHSPPFMRTHYASCIDGLPFTTSKNYSYVYYHSWNVSPHVYSPRFLYYHELDISLTAHYGWFNPFQRFSARLKLCAYCISLYTCDLDAAGDDGLGNG